eukprot:CAMPEP_0205944848 /NCGR_PEP_ID=MMETSP1325-20131115/64364_1 /ASSEMBLY_ACC=CAM_ASM_000708 /TAXON_ID=236786 /ORGANISM="Florenciella sp., Strain RCC1007" /LENGTH=43 /DNA_ID= /DNA_START= /DNA_END= /DNA_ORIENTATION=
MYGITSARSAVGCLRAAIGDKPTAVVTTGTTAAAATAAATAAA